LATCGFLTTVIKPHPKYGTYSYTNTEKAFPPKNRSGRSLDNFTLSKASNGELWTKWQERRARARPRGKRNTNRNVTNVCGQGSSIASQLSSDLQYTVLNPSKVGESLQRAERCLHQLPYCRLVLTSPAPLLSPY
jgi:hypothetical protein